MTRIDFYIVDAAGEPALATLCCRVAGKAHRHGKRIYVHTGSASLAALVDERLWTWSQSSFLPHARVGTLRSARDIERHPVIIGTDEPPPAEADLLINLAETVPSFFSRFDRVADLVDADDARRAAGRERYRFYRDRGYELSNHQISA